jgi:hypothetical protein
LAADASANASPKQSKSDYTSASDQSVENAFTAAIQMIASLPLSDAEKAEAVRRLLARGES